MILSDKLKQLREDIFNDQHSTSDIEDGWNRAIEDAEYYEYKIKKLEKELDKAERISEKTFKKTL